MQGNIKKTLKYYLKASLKYKMAGFFIIFSIITASFVSVIIPLYYKKFLDLISVAGADKSLAIPDLIHVLIYIIILNVLAWIGWRIATFTASYFQPKVEADLNNLSFAYLQKHSFVFFNNNFVGSLVKRVKWFSKAFIIISDIIFWKFLPLLIGLTVIITVLFSRNIYLGWAVVGWLVLFLTVNLFFTKYKLKYDIQRSEKESETTAVLADTITNHNNIRLFGGYKRELKNFASVIEQLRKIKKFTWNLSDIFEAIQSFMMIAFDVALMYLAMRLWQKGVLTVGDFILLQAYLINMFHRTWDFGKNIRKMYEALADAEEMTVILNTPHEVQDTLKAKKLSVTKGEIEFKNVDFYYRKTRRVFKNFNLNIRAGERIALVGPSGAGKTTVIKLLMRMHDVSNGEVLVDNQNITKVTQESLRSNVSLVPQNPILFHRTLMDNIRYGKPASTNQEIIAASKKAHCHEFVMKFSDKYDTYVGERGIKLSGGERQRVAIARAILRNSPILILDEATSSLDSASEALIQDAIDKLMKNKTVIVIAHRLSTIRKMDRIIFIDEGKIIEQGTHNELLAKPNSRYKELWNIQAGNFIE